VPCRAAILPVCLLAVAALAPAGARGEPVVSLAVGWNLGIHDLGSLDSLSDHDVDAVLFGAVYSDDFQAASHRSRFGVELATQGVQAKTAGERIVRWRYRATMLQVAWERAVLRGRAGAVALGVGTGPAWFAADDDQAPGPDGGDWFDPPDFGWVVTPRLRGQVRLVGPFALVLDVRGHVYTRDAAASYPFKSGVVFLAGIQFFNRSRD